MILRSTLLLLAATLPAQTITFAEGSPSSLTVAMVPEANPNGPDVVVLQGVELLPIEITGRTLAQSGDPSVSRRVDRSGLVRIELAGGGRLLRYRRGNGQFWGFLHIAADGSARVVLEQPGVGAQLQDPFADRIGVAADGRHAAIVRAAGGMWIVRLDGGVFASSGGPARLALPITTDVVPTSVLVGPVVVWCQDANNAVLRCAHVDGATAVDVSPPPQANAQLKDEMVMSGDGSRLVFQHGQQNAWRLWTVTVQGTPTLLPPPPGKYEEPSYLPEGPGEPAMLLNADGSRLFYVDALVRDELWLLDTAGVLPPLQITQDQIFQPYIGSHILPRFAAHRLVVAIGDPAQMDWFTAALAPGGSVVTNLSGTGSLQQPFPSGAIEPRQSAELGGALLLTEQSGTGLSLRALDPVTGANAVVVTGLSAPPVVGDALLGSGDVLVPALVGDRLYLGTGLLFAVAPPGFGLGVPTVGPFYAAVWVQLPIPFGVPAFYLPDGSLLLGGIEPGAARLALTPLGGTVQVGTTVRYLAPGVSVVLNRPAAALRWCLSGAGA